MDLRAIMNDDSSDPPPRGSPPAPAPIPAPILQGSASTLTGVSSSQPHPKRQKIREKPIWAQIWSSDWRNKPWAKFALAPTPSIRHSPLIQRPSSSQRPNGVAQNTQSPANAPTSGSSSDGGHKNWEANIVDRVPLDQMTKMVADFIFTHVISHPELGPDAKFEVEAKLGQLVNLNTNERLRLPVLTDCIVDKNDPGMRIAFRSTMTEFQHRQFNEFLNDAVGKSHLPPPKAPTTTPPPSRIPLSYKHTHQTDTLYELTPEGGGRLHPSTLARVSSQRNKPRVRITTDQKTHQEVAKIIKIRLGDLDVHSPEFAFDWRISINIEVDYKGSAQELVRVIERGQPIPERNKDRMTYNHLAYQIDLTQVTSPDQTKEHELEIEINKIDELVKQGNLAKSGLENNYEQIVRGLVDNVRLLQRLSMDQP